MASCTGRAHLFTLSRKGEITHEVKEGHRIHPSTLHPSDVSFVQCINYINLNSHAKGTLCGVLDNGVARIGCILYMDDSSTSIAFVTNPVCFFEPTSGTMKLFFNSVKNYTHEYTMRGKLNIVILNQLNGVPPYPAYNFDFSRTISVHDGCVNSSHLGPDVFNYKEFLHGDKLFVYALNLFHKKLKVGSKLNITIPNVRVFLILLFIHV